MPGAAGPPSQVLTQVPSEKRGGAQPAVLPDVRELVRQEWRGLRPCRKDALLRSSGEKDAAAEDDRVGAGERRQDPREPSAMKACPRDLGGETAPKALRQLGRDPVSQGYEPARLFRSDTICFRSTL